VLLLHPNRILHSNQTKRAYSQLGFTSRATELQPKTRRSSSSSFFHSQPTSACTTGGHPRIQPVLDRSHLEHLPHLHRVDMLSCVRFCVWLRTEKSPSRPVESFHLFWHRVLFITDGNLCCWLCNSEQQCGHF